MLTGATIGLVVAGGLVTSTGSGLAVPDWPLSYGQLMPPMVGGILFEHGHRMIATAVGAMTIVLAVWLWRSALSGRVRWLGWLALGGVIAQGLLGGLTVLLLLPTVVSVAHACLAQAFLALVTAIAVITSPDWQRLDAVSVVADQPPGWMRGFARLAIVTAVLVYVQLVLGATMRHLGAGLAIAEFPLVDGGLWPQTWNTHVAIHYFHRIGAAAVALMILAAAARALQSPVRLVRVPAYVLLVALPVQVWLGAATVLSQKAVAPTTAHVATGAIILAASVALALVAARLHLGAPPAEAKSAPALRHAFGGAQ